MNFSKKMLLNLILISGIIVNSSNGLTKEDIVYGAAFGSLVRIVSYALVKYNVLDVKSAIAASLGVSGLLIYSTADENDTKKLGRSVAGQIAFASIAYASTTLLAEAAINQLSPVKK